VADSNYLYVAEGGNGTQGGRVRRFELTDVNASATLIAGLHWPAAIALDSTDLYVADLGRGYDGTIQRVQNASLATPGARKVLATGQHFPNSLTIPPASSVASSTVFFRTEEDGETSLRTVSKFGGKVGVFAGLASNVHPHLVTDNNHLYVLATPLDSRGFWGTSFSSGAPGVNVLGFPLDGQPAELVTRFSSDANPRGLALKNDQLFISFPAGVKKVDVSAPSG
ncbi:MAG: hypothetical protein VKP62_06010, partial [Candidatus Sericytochromatia bacterium]|nr:hypothetical protein [Candidatus Sericytochromatia bacterium]